ncbi:MAG: hypothetical protein EA382_13770 [Spirochaetaceae bacterium]|nr:MAG: hypothetical protein EA382_13770 [Spirochaetaceae bacterium]
MVWLRRFVDQLAGRFTNTAKQEALMARFPFNPAEIHIGMNHRGTQYEIELRYVCLTDFAAIVIEPAEYAGGWILSAHIPTFGFPTRHGFVSDNSSPPVA